jgi:hypothetical protein
MTRHARLAALAALAALVVGAPVQRADAQAPERVVDEAGRPTPIAAYGGVAVWNVHDEAAGRYALHAWHDGTVVALPVKPRSVPFDADVGPDAHGDPVVVYSRCHVEPQGTQSFNGLPRWNRGRGCDLYRFRFSDGRERRLKAASDKRVSEMMPSIWRSRLAYFTIAEPRGRRRTGTVHLVVGGVLPQAARQVFPGGTRGPLDTASNPPVDGSSPSALDLRGTAATYGWSNLATCGSAGDDSGGGWNGSEVWEQTATSRRRLTRSCTPYGVSAVSR